MRCIWCGTKGGFANRLMSYHIPKSEPLVECEWCGFDEMTRERAANGKQSETH